MNRPLVSLFLFAFLLGGCPSVSSPPPPPGPGESSGGEEQGEESGETSTSCEEDTDCSAVSGTCEVALCVDQECITGPAEDGADCSDGNPCTTGDQCESGVCGGADELDCDDGNVCTADECDPLSGCKYVNHKDACDDDDICTTNDACSGGECLGSPSGECACEVVADCAEHEDGNFCNGTLTCSEDLNCVVDPATKVDCSSEEGPCVSVSCDAPTGSCVSTALEDDLSCDDSNECTLSDTCASGECVGELIEGCGCATDADCVEFDDDLFCNGVLRCVGAMCTIDIDSIPECISDDGDPCTVDACDEETQGCLIQAGNTGDLCEDGDVCTTESRCTAGECITIAEQNCDDGNACTDESCDSLEGCLYVDNESPCDDDDACTEGDGCVDGACVSGLEKDCDDGNACTDDPCDVEEGCGHENNESECDDGNACSVGDYCEVGTCKTGAETLGCDDGDGCTSDSCDGVEGCVFVAVGGAPCDDGDACTEGDLCDSSGACGGGTPVECGDDNACTQDACLSTSGCSFVPLGEGVCDDGDVCTIEGVCDVGLCVPGGAISCDDGNVCTIDQCTSEEGEGCTHVFSTQACSDGNECTENDACSEGACVSGSTKICSDDNPCTSAQCDPAEGCESIALVGKSCEDGDPACTLADACDVNGECASGPAPECDDGDVCTADFCQSGQGCVTQSAEAGTICDDGNPCTEGDNCFGGTCKPGQDSVCECVVDSDCPSAENKCNGLIICNTTQGLGPANTCQTDPSTAPPPCDSSEDTACFVSACVPDSGVCQLQAISSGTACDDGDACTTSDQCAGGACLGGPVTCVDGNACTLDACDSGQGCQFSTLSGDDCDDGTVCTENDTCVNGGCVGAALDCSDDNGCTSDSCNPLEGCANVLLVGSACDDGDPCTPTSSCDGVGLCAGFGLDACDDGTVCTDDSCDSALGGCVNTPAEGSCTDGDPCTEDDVCASGVCVAGAPFVCGDDGNICTGIACVGGEGCIVTSLTGSSCDDGSACTGEDQCKEDSSCLGFQTDCDDDDICTFDNCDPGSGCVYTDVSDEPGCPFFDGDGDGVIETSDNCPGIFNPEQLDTDDDGAGDACEIDPAPCTSIQDVQVITGGINPLEQVYPCEQECAGAGEVCQAQCMASAIGVSVGCSLCYVDLFNCSNTVCKEACDSGEGCNECVEGFCKPAFTECSLLGSAPQGGNCPETTSLFCDNSCWPPAWWFAHVGDGQCNQVLNCEGQGYDGGDCGVFVCDAGEIADCFGDCLLAAELLAMLDNNVCDPELNCQLYGLDGSLCEEVVCEGELTSNCLGECVDIFELEDEIGTGDCNEDYQCGKFNFDGADCGDSDPPCEEEEVTECFGECIPFEEVLEIYGDGICQISLACFEWDRDGKDCSGKCINNDDLPLLGVSELESSDFSLMFQECVQGECAGLSGSEAGPCVTQCISNQTGYTMGCSACFVSLVNCGKTNCAAECLSGGAPCEECLAEYCDADFKECAGFLP